MKKITFILIFVFVILLALLDIECIKSPTSNKPPSKPILVSPADGQSNVPLNTELQWNCSDPDGDALRYDIYFGASHSPSLIDSNQTATYYLPGELDYGARYYWKIVARDENNASTSSDSYYFTTAVDSFPGIPTLYTPVISSTISDTMPHFDWDNPQFAFRYELMVDNNSNWLSPEIDRDDLGSSDYSTTSGLASGVYYWRVRARNSAGVWGNWSMAWSFTVAIPDPVPAAPILNEPSDGSNTFNNMPRFDWNEPQYAYRYELIVDNNSDWISPEIHQDNIISSNYTPSTSLASDTYYWRVRARNSAGVWGDWSSVWSFTIEISDPVPDPPILYEPENNSTTIDSLPYFDWSNTEYAYRYELMVDNNSDWASPEIDQVNLTGSNYIPPTGLSDSLYYWRVRARNNSGIWGDWSDTWSFTINDSGPTPDAPILYEPANGSNISNNTPIFDWNDPQNAILYEIIVDNNSNFSSPEVHRANLDVSYCSAGRDLQLGLYYWKVRAKSNFGVWSDWSNIWTFTLVQLK
jgi:hypothetical protein